MMAIAAPQLEIAVLISGIAILLVETLWSKIEPKLCAYAGIVVLTAVLIGSFFVSPDQAAHDGAFWNFYAADALALFFKRFELVTTIVVLVMMIDYAPVLQRTADRAAPNLGEFFSLPLLTCAGLMYLVSAIDFIFIFVSLELVTISF